MGEMCRTKNKEEKLFIVNTEGESDMLITSKKFCCGQSSCQSVGKAGSHEPGIETRCKRLRNSREMKICEIPSEKLTAPDSSSLMPLRELCDKAWEKEIFPE